LLRKSPPEIATLDGTAIGASPAVGGDYKVTTRAFSFVSGGVRSKAVLVPVTGDGVLDAAAQETFSLNLRRVIAAPVSDGSALGTIVDLHAQPSPGPEPGPGDPGIIAPDAQGPVVDCEPGSIAQ
jgi:hypothetical protein